ncbi:hypothetical protein CANARDRAFT_29275 [[Candida] arabinofermentans NRRL YB-2248]|uniref:Uncharacterized protein n=1 Tax=[Candida] arabinofermentans NRRL YB-2248 TaxID=983967 RepID=A0A1E4SY91_9ASCO|nr:hypothetical protein CANARDRAFT_29275 [[Candida] arabinofermentans NRRL YB-2248]
MEEIDYQIVVQIRNRVRNIDVSETKQAKKHNRITAESADESAFCKKEFAALPQGSCGSC